jgi:WD40 repeat protein
MTDAQAFIQQIETALAALKAGDDSGVAQLQAALGTFSMIAVDDIEYSKAIAIGNIIRIAIQEQFLPKDVLKGLQDVLDQLNSIAETKDPGKPPHRHQRLFISYAHADDNQTNGRSTKTFARRLYNDLIKNGYEVWWDKVSMPNRALEFLREIGAAIEKSDRLLLLVGPHAVNSMYVREEWEFANSICIPVLPLLRSGDYDLLPDVFKEFYCPDCRDTQPYRVVLKEILRVLSQEVRPLGQFNKLPDLPSHLIARTQDLAELRQPFVSGPNPDPNSTTVLTSSKITSSIQGMGGIGKSVMANAFARDCNIRRIFGDGIFWLPIGQDPGDVVLYNHLRDIGSNLSDESGQYGTYTDAKVSVTSALSNKHCLLILDDVWDVNSCEIFKSILGPHCHLLITTRDRSISTLLEANEHQVGLLRSDQAKALLEAWTGTVSDKHKDIAERLGYLPLAIKLAGAVMKIEQWSPDAWLQEFDRVSRITLSTTSTDNRYTSLLANIEIGVQQAFLKNPDDKPLFYTFGVFKEDTRIPEDVIVQLWKHLRDDLDDHLLKRDIIGSLVKLALVERDQSGFISLHDLLHDYNHEKLGQESTHIHEALLDSYKKRYPQGWHSVQDDHYFYDHLTYHLKEANWIDQLAAAVKDLRYLVSKTVYRVPTATAGDLQDAQRLNPQDLELALLTYLFQYMTHVLNGLSGADEVGCTLYSRLQHIPNLAKLCNEFAAHLPPVRLEARHPLPDLVPQTSIRRLQGQNTWARYCTVSNDGLWVAATYDDGSIHLWDTNTWVSIAVIQAHNQEALCCAISPDRNWLLTGSTDGTLKIWDAATWSLVRVIEAHHNWIRDCKISPDGTWIVSAADDGTLKVWDTETGRLRLELYGHNYNVRACLISPDGQWIVTGASDGILQIWDSKTGAVLYRFEHQSPVECCILSPDQQWAISGSADGLLTLWNLADRSSVSIDTESGVVMTCDISPDGTRVVSGGKDGLLKIWDLRQMTLMREIEAHSSAVTKVVITPDGQNIVSTSRDGDLKIWDIASRTLRQNVAPVPRDVRSENIHIQQIPYEYVTEWHTQPLNGCGISADGSRGLSVGEDGIRVWDSESGRLLHWLDEDQNVYGAVFGPNEDHIIGFSAEGLVKVWNLQTGVAEHTFKGHEGGYSLKLSHSRKMLATTGSDNMVRLWDTTTWQLINTLTDFDGWVTDCCFDPTDQWIITSAMDKSLKIWDYRSGAVLREFAGHPDAILAIDVSTDGKLISAAMTNGQIWLWNSETRHRHTILNHGGEVSDVSFGHDGKWLVSTSMDGIIQVWNVADGSRLTKLRVDGTIYWCETHHNNLIVAGEGGLYWLQLVGI